MKPQDVTQTTKTAEIIASYRKSKLQNLREFGAELGVSYTQVMYWENGTNIPDGKRIDQWVNDDRAWVKSMGLHVLAALRPSLIHHILVPEI